MRKTTDMKTWFIDCEGKIFRYVVYKRMFTPYEQQHAFMDETQYESVYYSYGYIDEVIELGGGEWLLGIRKIYEGDVSDSLTYYKLSEIRLELWETDQKMLEEDYDSEDDEE